MTKRRLMQLKKTTAKTLQVLNAAKLELSEILMRSDQLRQGTTERETAIAKLSEEMTKVQQVCSSCLECWYPMLLVRRL